MSVPSTAPPGTLRLGDRLLMELVRLREESAGHPPHTPDADARAIAAGGDFAQRLAARAQALPESDARLRALRHLRRSALALVGIALTFSGIAGIAAASTTLGSRQPVSLPLLVCVLVGFNLLSLLLWLAIQPWSSRAAPGLGRLIRQLWTRWERHALASSKPAEPADSSALDAIRLLAGGSSGRWLLGAVVHAAWLAFSLCALLTLAVLLSVRAYELAWETTLLSPQALAQWAHWMSLGPALLGATGPETLPVDGALDSGAREAWAVWLLAALVVYGVLPRLLALLACVALAMRALSNIGRDLTRPGYARLRTRLLPDHAGLGVVDPVSERPSAPRQRVPRRAARGRGRLALGLEWAPDEADAIESQWQCHWLGVADGAEQRRQLLDQLAQARTGRLIFVARATATPDRGNERFAVEAIDAAQVPAILVLAAFERLQARGNEATQRRLDEWQAFATRAGMDRVLPWCANATGALPTLSEDGISA